MGDTNSNNGNNTNTNNKKPEWLQQYDLLGKIGEGTYGLVFLARIKSSTNRGKSIAIKKFKQSKDGDGVSPTAIREIMVKKTLNFWNLWFWEWRFYKFWNFFFFEIFWICDCVVVTRNFTWERGEACECSYQSRRHVAVSRFRLRRTRPLCMWAPNFFAFSLKVHRISIIRDFEFECCLIFGEFHLPQQIAVISCDSRPFSLGVLF